MAKIISTLFEADSGFKFLASISYKSHFCENTFVAL